MNKTICTLLITIVSLLFVVPGHTEIYKWIDSKGVVHFGDKPPDNEKSEIANITVTQPSVSNPSSKASGVEVIPSEANSKSNRKSQSKKIVMYGTVWCPYCKKAREYFGKNGIRFVEYNVEKLPSRMREFKKLGGTGYPLILIGKGQKMQGFSASGFERRYNQ